MTRVSALIDKAVSSLPVTYRGPGGAVGAPVRRRDRLGGRRFHHMITPLIASSQTAMQPISMTMRLIQPYCVP